jgi:BON domain
MENDTLLRQNVHKGLTWEPRVNASRIGVAVQDGVVTLTGDVDSCGETWEDHVGVEPTTRAFLMALQTQSGPPLLFAYPTSAADVVRML